MPVHPKDKFFDMAEAKLLYEGNFHEVEQEED